MLSVTARIDQITQPYGGYLPVSSFRTYAYDVGQDLETVMNSTDYGGLQGLTVDYLTRFLSGSGLEKAFEISLEGASIVGQEENAAQLLQGIKGLDRASILNAYQLVGYDVAYRRGPDYFSDTKFFIPQEGTISNIEIMVQRGLSFLNKKEQLLRVGFQFVGGYSKIISSGDGDYLTRDGLWDFKTSIHEPTSKDSLQILIYYLMGLHTGNPAFQRLKQIGLFNPFLNKSYEISLFEIPDSVFHAVSRDVIGYRIPDEIGSWRNVTGDDERVVNDTVSVLLQAFKSTDFNPEKYEDGIHDISADDYWTYYRTIADNPFSRPKFTLLKSIKFLKHDGYLMFITETQKGSLCILRGGAVRKLDKWVGYYYEKLPVYGKIVTELFSHYWDAIFQIARYVGEINGQGSARVHGCIVDIDYFNHVFLSPNGRLSFYYSPMFGERISYPSFPALLAGQTPHLLKTLDSCKLPVPFNAAEERLVKSNSLPVLEFGTDMYGISNQMKAFQLVHDNKLVAIWQDQLLPIQRELLPYCQRLADQEIAENFKQYATLKYKRKNENSWILTWEPKKRIRQMELIAVVKKLLIGNYSDTL